MYGMMHRMSQAAQQSQVRGAATLASDSAKTEHEKFKAALERIEGSPFIKGYEAIAIAREALGIKSK